MFAFYFNSICPFQIWAELKFSPNAQKYCMFKILQHCPIHRNYVANAY